MEAVSTRTRYRYLDIARGLGLMVSVVSHCCGLSDFLLYSQVPMFFLLSGYVYRAKGTYASDVRRRAKRLLVPYFGYSALLVALYALIRRSVPRVLLSIAGVLYSRYSLYDTSRVADDANVYFFTIANNALWFFTASFVAYLIFRLVVGKCLENKRFCVISIIAMMLISMALADILILLPWSIDFACTAAFFMLAGTLLAREDFFEKKSKVPVVILIIAIYVVSVIVNPGANYSVREYGRFQAFSVPFIFVCGVTGAIIYVWVSKLIQNNFIGRLMEFVGDHTVSLLAMHVVLLEFMEVAASKFINIPGKDNMPMFILYNGVRSIVAIVVSIAFGEFVDWCRGKWKALRSARAQG